MVRSVSDVKVSWLKGRDGGSWHLWFTNREEGASEEGVIASPEVILFPFLRCNPHLVASLQLGVDGG